MKDYNITHILINWKSKMVDISTPSSEILTFAISFFIIMVAISIFVKVVAPKGFYDVTKDKKSKDKNIAELRKSK